MHRGVTPLSGNDCLPRKQSLKLNELCFHPPSVQKPFFRSANRLPDGNLFESSMKSSGPTVWWCPGLLCAGITPLAWHDGLLRILVYFWASLIYFVPDVFREYWKTK
jgi:hypothetical protein